MPNRRVIWVLACLLGLQLGLQGQAIREFMDLQIHPAMHMAYGFFDEGLTWQDPAQPDKQSWKHTFRNVITADHLAGNAGARIIVNGVILPEVGVSRKRARARVLEQLAYVNDFAAANADKFVVARTPQEVRDAIHYTDKTVIIHSIEGAKRLLNGPEDARYWAAQGIAFMTLVHLIDDEFGGAAIQPELTTRVINYTGSFRRKFKKKHPRGLTDKGKNAIQWLADAGIMTDLTHMSDQTRKDALTYMEAHKIPPIVSHDMFKPIQNQPRGIEPEDIRRIYALGGFVSLPISGMSTKAHDPWPEYAEKLAALEDHCPGSIDSWKFTYTEVQKFVEGSIPVLWEDSSVSFLDLTEQQKELYPIGFQTDFNGWLDHHRPRYGKDGCAEITGGKAYEEIELQGLAHPGLLESHWRLMEKEGVDLEPIRRASERFLQLWQWFLDHRTME